MSINLKPLGDRVVIAPVDDVTEQKSPGGIIIPDTAKEKPQQGKIVAVGPGRSTDEGTVVELSVKVGDEVIYSKYAGTEYKYKGNEYLIVKESDIIAVVD